MGGVLIGNSPKAGTLNNTPVVGGVLNRQFLEGGAVEGHTSNERNKNKTFFF